MEQVPMGGFGYGVLRHLHRDPALRGALQSQGDPPILFNYLGRLAGTEHGLKVADLDRGGTRSPGNRRLAWLHAECWDGGDSVGLRLDFHDKAFTEAGIAELLDEWQKALLFTADHLAPERTGT
jgi:non-ribosomal peptide synthase protein (TIGR01720 family)